MSKRGTLFVSIVTILLAGCEPGQSTWSSPGVCANVGEYASADEYTQMHVQDTLAQAGIVQCILDCASGCGVGVLERDRARAETILHSLVRSDSRVRLILDVNRATEAECWLAGALAPLGVDLYAKPTRWCPH